MLPTNSDKETLASMDDDLLEINLAYIKGDNLDTASVNGITEDEQLKHYKNKIANISSEALINQAEQIINYADNYMQTGTIHVEALFENCSLTMKKYIKEDKTIDEKKYELFCKSLDNSQDCIADTNRYETKIKELKNNDRTSFIMAPITGIGHMFSTAIYKKDNKYEFIVVNKGDSFDSTKNKNYTFCTKYILPEENIQNILDIFGKMEESDRQKMKVEEVYQLLEKNSVDKEAHLLNHIDAREQRVGNCFFKEVEEGLKYVYSEAFDRYEKNSYLIGENKRVEKITPKLPCKTQKFHNELLNNIKEYSGEKKVIQGIEDLIDTYNKNKNFREQAQEDVYLKGIKTEELFSEIFGDGKGNLNDEVYLKKCLEKVDERTLYENIEFFIKLLKDRNIKTPMIMYNALDNPLKIDFLEIYDKYKNSMNETTDMEFFDNYFPNIAEKIRIKSNIDEGWKIINNIIKEKKNKNYDVAVLLSNKGLLMDLPRPIKGIFYKELADVKRKQGNLKEALYLYQKGYNDICNVDVKLVKPFMTSYNQLVDEIASKKEKLQLYSKKSDNESEISKARILNELGHEKEALIIYDKYINDISKNGHSNELIAALMEKAEILNRIGGNEKSMDDVYKKIISLLDSKLAKDKNDYITLQIKGDFLRKQGKSKEAISVYKDLLNTLNRVTLKNHDNAVKIYTDSISNKIKGIYEKEKVELDIIELKEKKMGKKEEKEHIIQPINYNKGNIDNIKEIAKKLQYMGREEDAINYYMEALKHKNDIESFKSVIILLRTANKSDKALQLIDKELQKPEIYDKDNKPLNRIAYVQYRLERVKCLLDLGKKEYALDECKYIIDDLKLEQISKTINRNLTMRKAMLLQELGYKKQALEEYQRVYNMYVESVPPRNLTRNMKKVTKDLENNLMLSQNVYKYRKDTLNLLEVKRKELPIREKLHEINKVTGIDFSNDSLIRGKIEEMDNMQFSEFVKSTMTYIETYKGFHMGEINKQKLKENIIGRLKTINIVKKAKELKNETVQLKKENDTASKIKNVARSEEKQQISKDERINQISTITGIDCTKDAYIKEKIGEMSQIQFDNFKKSISTFMHTYVNIRKGEISKVNLKNYIIGQIAKSMEKSNEKPTIEPKIQPKKNEQIINIEKPQGVSIVTKIKEIERLTGVNLSKDPKTKKIVMEINIGQIRELLKPIDIKQGTDKNEVKVKRILLKAYLEKQINNKMEEKQKLNTSKLGDAQFFDTIKEDIKKNNIVHQNNKNINKTTMHNLNSKMTKDRQ